MLKIHILIIIIISLIKIIILEKKIVFNFKLKNSNKIDEYVQKMNFDF